MSAGNLREHIVLKRRDSVKDAMGSEAGTLLDIDNYPNDRAEITSKSAKPQLQGDKTEYVTYYEVKMRYRGDIDERLVIYWKEENINLSIEGLRKGRKRDYIYMTCSHIDG